MTKQIKHSISDPQEISLRRIIRWSWMVYWPATVVQLLFFGDLTNLAAVCAIGVAWLVATKVFMRPVILNHFPFSTFLILGFTSTQFFFPLLFTTLEARPVTYNLELPEQVFFHSIAALSVLLVAHAFYRQLSKLTYNRSFSLMEKAGFFIPPTELQLWLFGLIGMVASLYVYFFSEDMGREVTGTAGEKFLQALVPFSYAPFFIPMGRLYGAKDVDLRRVIPLLAAFTVLLFGISIGRNSRGAFMGGFIGIGYSYLLGILLGIFDSKIFTAKNMAIGALGIWLLVGPLAELGTAMVIVRGEREKATPMEMIELTLETFTDKETIRKRRIDDNAAVYEDWDERYLDNIFTSRFANLKYNDVSLVHASIVREYDPDMLDFSIDYILGALPEPFLEALGVDIDKELVYSLSIGDYLYIASGGSGPVTGFRTGHFAGTGMTTFGWWYLFILGVGMVPIFWLFDKFLKKKNVNVHQADSAGRKQTMILSFCGVLAITKVFHYLPDESVILIAQFLIRGWIQIAILYLAIFHTTRLFTRFIDRARSIKLKRIHAH